MNIALVVYSHYSRDARVRRYVESLAREGHQVDVISLCENYAPSEKNIHLFMLPLNRTRRGKVWYIIEYVLFFLYSFLILSIQSLIKGYKVVHINNMPDFLVFSAIIPKLIGSKVILDMHDPMPELYMSKFHAGEKNVSVRFLKFAEKLSLHFAHQVLTANPEFKRIFLSRDDIQEDKIEVILNCPDTRIFKPITNQQLAINNQQFTLLYMGTVDERFGLDIAIEAIPSLIQRIPNLRFIIIPKIDDEGKCFQRLRGLVKERNLVNYVIFKKPVVLEVIAEELEQIDLGVVLAKNGVFTDNIFPVKLLEFIQMGIPVIATKTKILSKYFTSNDIYFLTQNTPSEFSKAVIDLYNNQKLRKKLSRSAKKYLKVYNWEKEKKKYLALVNSLLEQ